MLQTTKDKQTIKVSKHWHRSCVWLAKWCKIHKVYIHSHSRLLLLFTNIFIYIQQLSLHSRNIFVYIWRHVSYSRIYLLTFTRCIIHIQRLISVHIYNPNIHSTQCKIHSTFSAHSLCASLGPSSQRVKKRKEWLWQAFCSKIQSLQYMFNPPTIGLF